MSFILSSMNFRNLNKFLENFESEKILENGKRLHSPWARQRGCRRRHGRRGAAELVAWAPRSKGEHVEQACGGGNPPRWRDVREAAISFSGGGILGWR
jgi:hypothetical protein